MTYDDRLLSALCKKWRITQLGLFGSAVGGDFGPESDVDVLVTFDPDAAWSLFDLLDLKACLVEIFSRKVDLVETAAIRNPYRRRSILASRKVIYEATKDG